MIWLTWRQHRGQLLFGAAALAVIAAFLLPSGFRIWNTFRGSGLAACLGSPAADCGELADTFLNRFSSLQFTIPLFLVLPGLLGVFWGAPMVARETEQGTHRLAWTQSVTRLRWMSTKIVALVAATAAGTAVLSFLLSWWSRPLVTASNDRFQFGIFDLRGVVPIAYALFALAVGVAAGVLIRRTVPAMGATLGAYAAVRVAIEVWARPRYLAAKTATYAFKGLGPGREGGDWVLSMRTVDRAGNLIGRGGGIDLGALAPGCPGLLPANGGFPDQADVFACVQRLGIHVRTTYQPANRYWLFEGIESAIFVALAAGLLVFSVWWVRRRAT